MQGSTTSQMDAGLASPTSPPLSPLHHRPPSGTGVEKMRVNRSSSRITESAASRNSDETDVGKTAVKVGMATRPSSVT